MGVIIVGGSLVLGRFVWHRLSFGMRQ